MELNLKKYSLNLGILMVGMAVIHLLLYRISASFLGILLKEIIEIYVFLLVLNLVHFVGLKWLFKKWAKYAGLLFTAMSLLKMALCILFLFPYILPSTVHSIPIAMNFMVVYFVTLTYEVIFLVKNLTKSL